MSGSRKRRVPKRKKKRIPGRKSIFFKAGIKKWLAAIFLICFFLFSILVLGYVVFFRTVLAKEVVKVTEHSIVFEEPFAPVVPDSIKKRTVVSPELPRIAIIIDDMGYDGQLGRQLLGLDMKLCFSFLPFAPFTRELDEIAYKAGRTILLHLPLQPKSSEWDPGPGALYLGENRDRIQELFEKSLNSVPHATGVNNHMGSLYTENSEAMTILMAMIKEKELFFVDSFTTVESVGARLAVQAGVKTARRHVFLDNILSEEKVCGQLEKLVETAEQQGYGIGIGHPYQVTLLALSKCMDRLSSRVKLVSVTELLH